MPGHVLAGLKPGNPVVFIRDDEELSSLVTSNPKVSPCQVAGAMTGPRG